LLGGSLCGARVKRRRPIGRGEDGSTGGVMIRRYGERREKKPGHDVGGAGLPSLARDARGVEVRWR